MSEVIVPAKLDFMIIGAMKSGTTSLAFYLNQSSQIYIPKEKELPFFLGNSTSSKHFDNFYKEYFSKANSSQIVGTSTPQYMMHPNVFKKIHKAKPNIKLIAILRDPIERLVSHYNHSCRLGVENRELKEIVIDQLASNFHDELSDDTTQKYISSGEYGYIFEEVLKHFKKEQILLIKFESFKNNTQHILNEISNFLGIGQFDHNKQFKIYMKGGKEKLINIDHDKLINKAADYLSQKGLKKFVPNSLKKKILLLGSTLDRVNVKKNSKDSTNLLDKKLLQKIHEHYEKDQKKFESLNLEVL